MQYTVQDPRGNNRIIEGPDGASDEEVISQAQQLFGMSGGRPESVGLDTLNKAIQEAKLKAPIGPSQGNNGFAGDQSYLNDPYQNSSPPGQRILENGQMAADGFYVAKTPEMIYGAGKAVAGAGSKLLDWISTMKNATRNAEALAPAETALQSGLAAKEALAAEKAAGTATKNKLYAKVADVTMPITSAQSTADSIVNEVKGLPASFQSKKILALVGDIQNLDKTSVSTVQAMRSTLGDMATNGEGVEKFYAARLSKALGQDVENFGKTNLVNGTPQAISQGPSLEAGQLRDLWGNTAKEQSGTAADTIASYKRPDVFQAATPPITNSDIPENLTKANSFYKDFMDLQNHPVTQALNRARPEEMMDQIFKRGNVDDVRVAQSVLGRTAYNSVSRQFYEQLRTSKDVTKAMAKYTPEFLNEAIGSQAVTRLEALGHLQNLISLGYKAVKGATGVGVGVGIYKALKH